MATKVKRSILFFVVIVLTAIIIGTVMQFASPPGEKGIRDYIGLFKEVVVLLNVNYVEKIDNKKLMESAVNGMLTSLDPHSVYMPPDTFEEMQTQISGSFGGLGIEITIKENKLTVISPLEDTPAFRAGIRPGDQIWMIDKAFTRGMNINDAVKRMRGPKGTMVTLTIGREGMAKPLVLTLTRDIIRIRSVKYRILAKGYGYVRITQFQEDTGDEFARALRALRAANKGTLRGMVLDLRNNPGGLVDPAIEVAGRFISGGSKDGLIVSLRGREPSSRKELSSPSGEKEPHYPLVVLINSGSASASEIVAGALQDYKRAVIMGTQSFGKGSVQSVIPMGGGAGLKLTTARYFTPKGRSIQALGITPDIIVGDLDAGKPKKESEQDFHEEDLDGHILPAGNMEMKKDRNNRHPKAPGGIDFSGDYQLSRALDLLKGFDLLGDLR